MDVGKGAQFAGRLFGCQVTLCLGVHLVANLVRFRKDDGGPQLASCWVRGRQKKASRKILTINFLTEADRSSGG